MTDAAQSIARFTVGLEEERKAQDAGKPSPGIENANRHINRLLFGVDTADTRYAFSLDQRRDADVAYREKVKGWTSRWDELNAAVGEDTSIIAAGQGSDPAVQRAFADRDAVLAEMEKVRAEAIAGTDAWRASLLGRGEEDYRHDMDAALAARARGQDAPFGPTAAAGQSLEAYVAAATRAAEAAVFGKVQVQLDPASKADVSVSVTVHASDDLVRAAADAKVASAGNIAAHVGRMDSDAAPPRYNRAH
jgi:hypothetical protein